MRRHRLAEHHGGSYPGAMVGFLDQGGIPLGRLKPFLLQTSGMLRGHAQRMARDRGRRRQSAKVSRILQRFHARRLIAQIPHSRKWRVTKFGQRVMATSIQPRQLDFPRLMALAA